MKITITKIWIYKKRELELSLDELNNIERMGIETAESVGVKLKVILANAIGRGISARKGHDQNA